MTPPTKGNNPTHPKDGENLEDKNVCDAVDSRLCGNDEGFLFWFLADGGMYCNRPPRHDVPPQNDKNFFIFITKIPQVGDGL